MVPCRDFSSCRGPKAESCCVSKIHTGTNVILHDTVECGGLQGIVLDAQDSTDVKLKQHNSRGCRPVTYMQKAGTLSGLPSAIIPAPEK